jgi:hypothetical protein
MSDSATITFAVSLSDPWVIPTLGVVVGALAFLAGLFFLGARKASVPPPAEAPAVAAGQENKDIFLHGSYGDRRSAPRRRGNSVEVDLSNETDHSVCQGWVLDRSVGGLCIVVEEPVAEGTVLRVRPHSASDSVPWTPIEIRGCRAHKNEWELNCQFLQTPNWNVMMMFG